MSDTAVEFFFHPHGSGNIDMISRSKTQGFTLVAVMCIVMCVIAGAVYVKFRSNEQQNVQKLMPPSETLEWRSVRMR